MENSGQAKPDLDQVVEDLKDYVDTSLELYKLKAGEKGAEVASGAIITIVLALLAVLVLIFVSIGIAVWLSAILGKPFAGYLIVGGFYALVGLIILVVKEPWLKGTLTDNIIKSLFGK